MFAGFFSLDLSDDSSYYGVSNRFLLTIQEDSVSMKTIKVALNSIDRVKKFVNDINRFDSDFDLVSGRYVIDAKSIMGIFSLDLSKPIDLNIHAEGDKLDVILKSLEQYKI